MQARIEKTPKETRILVDADIPEKNLADVSAEGGRIALTLTGLPTLGQIISLERREGRRYELMWSGKHYIPLSLPDDVRVLGYRFIGSSLVIVITP